jgi:hypothetical protein
VTPEKMKRLLELRKKEETDDGLSSEEDRAYGNLLDERRTEQILSIPHPTCCEAIQKYPAVAFWIDSYFSGLAYSEAPGRWRAALHEERAEYLRLRHGAEPAPDAKFCPFCAAALPAMRRKVPAPEGICRPDDGGDHCLRCGERLINCLCDRPETAFESSSLVS